jgi:hypothetical protein
VGVLFYLKPDGQYILAVDDGMAVFLFIVIMFSAMIDSGRSFLLKVIRTSHSIIITKIQP